MVYYYYLHFFKNKNKAHRDVTLCTLWQGQSHCPKTQNTHLLELLLLHPCPPHPSALGLYDSHQKFQTAETKLAQV